MTALEHNRSNLSQQLTETKEAAAASINELERKLSSLTVEQSTICAALEKLVDRQEMEMKEDEARNEQARLLADEKAKAAAREEERYFAALWIQLRWKAYLKRQLVKQATAKSKKKGGKKKSTK